MAKKPEGTAHARTALDPRQRLTRAVKEAKAGTPTAPAPQATDPRERAALALERQAEAGDVQAIRALANGTADRLRQDGGGRDPKVDHRVAAAAIAAGLAEAERLGLIEGDRPDWHGPPATPQPGRKGEA